MICPACGHKNKATAKICVRCETAFVEGYYDAREIEREEVSFLKHQGRYADIFSRFLAAFVDGVIIGLLMFFARVVFAPFGLSSFLDKESLTGILVELVVFWLYSASMESSIRQATPGKLLVGIHVTDLNNERITFTRATKRHFGKYLSTLVLFIGWLMPLFTEKKQALHDKLAGCLIIPGPVK